MCGEKGQKQQAKWLVIFHLHGKSVEVNLILQMKIYFLAILPVAEHPLIVDVDHVESKMTFWKSCKDHSCIHAELIRDGFWVTWIKSKQFFFKHLSFDFFAHSLSSCLAWIILGLKPCNFSQDDNVWYWVLWARIS